MDAFIERLNSTIDSQLEVRVSVREKFLGAAINVYCRKITEDYAFVYLRFRVKDHYDLQMFQSVLAAFEGQILSSDD